MGRRFGRYRARSMEPLVLSARVLVDPVGAMPRAVEARRWVLPLVLLCTLAAASGAAVATRVDTARAVIPKMEMSGQLAKASEKEIDDEVTQARRVGIVGGVAAGLFLTPLEVLALAVALKLFAWLLGRKATFAALWTVAVIAMLPAIVHASIVLVAALNQGVLAPKVAEGLVPTSLAALVEAPGKLAGVYKAVDFFKLWGALLMGLGFASAAKLKPWQGALLGLVLYVMFAMVVFVALPGLSGGGGGGPPGGGGHP
jgi:hypothetical protein